LANLGRYQEALASFDRAVEVQPDDYAAWVFRGVVLIHLCRYPEALLSCNKALQIRPNDREAWTFRGVALYYLGRHEEAYTSYSKALGTNNTSQWQKFFYGLRKIIKRLRRFLHLHRFRF